MSADVCPGCGSESIRVIGPIPDNRMFAGREVGSAPAKLATCRRCHLGFRLPQPRREDLAAMYEAGSDTAWSEDGEPQRRDWDLAAGWVSRVGASSVLDVGCFDGGFLRQLPDSIAKAGVEIHPAAAQRAAEAGVRIVAADLHDLAVVNERFDLVSAFDVIEHVHNPSEFLESLSNAVRPGGHVVFATGNLDARTWRAMGSRYLYSWFLEHISFVSPRWIERQAPRLGLEIVAVDRFSHTSDVPLGFLIGALKNGLYRLSPRLVDSARTKAGQDQLGELPAVPPAPPAWTSARDHILVVLRKAG